ncbi:MAG: tryptophan--tRNA ligase [bacterium]
MERVLSGMRPTGKLHLGHLKGALENWKFLQERYECLYMIADWHALMSEYQSSKEIANNTKEVLIDWLSFGIDPKKAIIFCQSEIPCHSELYLLFSIITPLGWLKRNPTYKEQIQELSNLDLETHGFLGYPVLQGADILLYKATIVPIGVDQLPHLELTRELLRRFNHLYSETFPTPSPLLTETPKLPGTDGRKMSKSYNNAIFISDSSNEIRKKIKMMITDKERIYSNDPGHPDICNVFDIWKAFSKEKSKEIERECKNAKIGCVSCKDNLSFLLSDELKPIREKREELEKDSEYLSKILKEGRERAYEIASRTMAEIRKKIGFYG